MNDLSICFLARPSYDVFSTQLYLYMRENCDKNLKGIFVTSNKTEEQYVRNQVPGAVVYNVSRYMREHWSEFSLEKLTDYEQRYECTPIWKYIYSDRFLINRDFDYCVHITVGLFSLFEKIFTDNQVDFYYSETIATLQCYVAYLVGKKKNVKYVAQFGARGNLDCKYFYFVNDEYQHDAYLGPDYKTQQYSKEERERADRYLKDFETVFTPPESEGKVKMVPHINIEFLKGPMRRFVKSFNRELNDPYSYMYYKSYKDYTNEIKFWLNYQKYKHCFVEPDYNRKYVFFPLHFQPEASTCVCAEKYEKQLYFIDSWAKSLPSDVVLYVKEHHAQLGHRDPHFYKELKKYPNVFLIDPLENPRKLIDHAYAITTLTGTVAYEAMLLRKPVIMGGKIVFDFAPGIVRVDDIYGRFTEIMSSWKQPTRDEVIDYLCALFRTYKKGNCLAENYPEYIEDNLTLLGDSLYQYCLEQKNGKNCF